MNRPADRDAALESVLRRLPAPDLGGELAGEDCLDAETIAALAEGAISPRERELAEAHAAGCSRCQNVIAAVIRTAPEPAPSEARWWSRPAVWLTPFAAVGAAVALWVAVDNRGAPASVGPISTPTVATDARAEPPSAASPDTGASLSDARSLAKQERRDALSSVRGEAEPTVTGRVAPSVTKPAPAVPVPAPSVAAELTVPVTVPAQPQELGAPVPGPPPPSAPPLPQAPAASAMPVANSAPAASRSDAAAGPARAFSMGGAAGGVAAKASATRTEITSPDPRSRWRISGATVERSTDAGVTWTPQLTGTDAVLIAGSAPQPNICWLVGVNGTVLVSADGLTWQRVTPPVAASILAVAASSADAAVVTTSDGRAYATTDRGRSWSPRQ